MTNQWQPISTAPKDGTSILISERYCDNPFVGFYSQGKWRASLEFVEAVGWDAGVTDRVYQPDVTHWMPLPEPPT